MAKKCLAALLAVLLLLVPALPAAAEEAPAFDVNCKAAILIDQDSGKVLYEKQADLQVPIASITKVMTLLLTMDALKDGKITLEQTVPVSAHSYGMGGSQIWLEPGESFTLEELLKAICVCSANDAAVAVAELVGGSEDVFVSRMNDRAEGLGMTGTHFCNACGLDEAGHVSTARDVALMSREILSKYPEIQQYTTIWMDSLRGGATQLVNTNKMLHSYNGITGLKTGTTGGAGICISASATRDDLNLIAVVLGAPTSKDRFEAASTLLDYGFANYRNLPVELPADAPQSLPVERGTEKIVALTYEKPDFLLTGKGSEGAVTVQMDLPEKIAAPVAEGQQLGILTVQADGQPAGEFPVRAAAGVEKLSFARAFEALLKGTISGGAEFVQNE